MEIELTLNDIHKEETKILEQFIKFCDQHGLKYYIDGGTLLGAVRHKGFIPWDDDIDCMMPREDFIKFEEIIKKQDCKLTENYMVTSFDLGNLYLPFIKIVNNNIKIDNYATEDENEMYLWIDVFPMDGIPENELEALKLAKKIKFWRQVLLNTKIKKEIMKKEYSSKLKLVFKILIKTLLDNNFGKKIIIKRINKIVMNNKYSESKYVGEYVWGLDNVQEKCLKSDIGDCELEFEGLKVNALKNYDMYLKNLYGDYMELPPKEKRKTHRLKAYYVKKSEE